MAISPRQGGVRQVRDREIERAAKELTSKAMEVIEEILNNSQNSAYLRMAAAKEVLDRGWGKSRTGVAAENVDDLNSMSDEDLHRITRAAMPQLTHDPAGNVVIMTPTKIRNAG